MSLVSSDPYRHRILSLVGVIGGVLAVLGFFLPWYGMGLSQQANGVITDSTLFRTVSGWDLVNLYLTGTPLKPSFGPTPIAVAPAIIEALPLVFALVALLTSTVMVFVNATPLLSSLSGAAGILGISDLSLGNAYAHISHVFAGLGYPATAGVGLVLLSLGFFAIIVGSIARLIRSAKQSANGSADEERATEHEQYGGGTSRLTRDTFRRSVPSLLGIGGGIAVVVGFFLPWYPPSTSGWGLTNVFLTGASYVHSPLAPPISPVLAYAIILALPVVFALVAVVTSSILIFVKATPILSALFITVGVMEILSLLQSGYYPDTVSNGLAIGTPITPGIGILLLSLGFFGIMAGSIASLINVLRA